MKTVSKDNARALWDWRGDEELAETKQKINASKLVIQKIANQMVSKKGHTLKQLERINLISGQLIINIRYLKEIHSIRDIADL